jgi:hypothetical protein
MDSNHITGITIGFIVGFVKAISILISSLSNVLVVISIISWEQIFDTGSLTLIGGACGWLGAEAMKRISKIFQKKKEK